MSCLQFRPYKGSLTARSVDLIHSSKEVTLCNDGLRCFKLKMLSLVDMYTARLHRVVCNN